MRVAGRLASEVLDYIAPFVKAGITTGELDRLCHDYMVNEQGFAFPPAELRPSGYTPYPKSICTSINHQVCHGVPGDKALKNGTSSISTSPSSRTASTATPAACLSVGDASIQAKRLCEITFECMWIGINQVRPGGHLGDIGAAIQKHAEANGYSVVREFCGHGIGRKFHEDPQVLHYGRPARPRLEPGHDLHHRTDDQRRQGRDP